MNAGEYGLEDSTGHLLLCIGSEIKRQFAQAVERYGVTTQQCLPLMVLYRGTCDTPTEMAKAIGIDVGGVSRLTDRLERKGLVQRVSDRQDKRSVRVELTREGRRLAPKLLEASNELNKHVFGATPGKTGRRAIHKTLKEVLDRLTQAA